MSYGPLCTEFYDADKPQAPADAVAYYVGRARGLGGAVLEPMCGSGRFLLPLARAGLDVEGVDAAPAMLDACRRHALAEGLRPVLHHQALEALALPRRYTMALVPSGSIGLIEAPALDAALRRIQRHLAPGGVLLLELLVLGAGDRVTTCEDPPRVVQVGADGEITYRCRAHLAPDGASIRYDGHYEKREGGTLVGTETESLTLHLHHPEGLVERLVRNGFEHAGLRPGNEYPSLADSGCVLIEARVPRP